MGYPICVEMWLREEDSSNDIDLLNLTLSELKSFGVIENHKVNFSKIEKAKGGGFPLPTIRNIESMNEIRTQISNQNIDNLVSLGVYSSKNVFFIKDVLTDTYNKVVLN